MLALMIAALSMSPFQSHPDTLQIPPCPDLGIVRVEHQPLRCGLPAQLRAVVGNIGGAAAEDSSSVAFFFPMMQITREARIGPVPAGGEVTTEWTSVPLPPGDHILVTCADFRGEIDEDNVTNNCTYYAGLNATHYDIRYSTEPDTPWEQMTPVPDPPSPASPGAPESVIVGELAPSTRYYFRMKVGNHNLWSGESNIATEETLP